MKRSTRLAKALLQIRHERGIPLRTAARRAGMRPARWKRYEDGSVEPRFATIERILRALGVGAQALGRALSEGEGPLRAREQALLSQLRRVSGSFSLQLEQRLRITFRDEPGSAKREPRHPKEGSR